jgi:TolB protein
MALRDGSDVQRVSFIGKYNESAAWSPEGDRIAYCSMDGGKLHIYTSALDGTDVHKLTFEGNNERPAWSPDGMSIAFASDRSGSYQIYIMRRDGSGATRITNAGENTSPAWSNNTNKGVP